MAGKTLTPIQPAPEPEPTDEKGFGEVLDEYDCGKPCTPNGCPGHDGMPVGFWLDGVTFHVMGYEGGDFPSGILHENQQAVRAIAKVERLNKLEEALRELAAEWRKEADEGFERAGTPGTTQAVAEDTAGSTRILCAEDIEELLKGKS